MLERQIIAEGDDQAAPVAWSAGDLEAMNRFSAWLEQECRDIERRYKVRLVE